MVTTTEWLAEVKASKEKFYHWLERQYIGEALAAQRISALAQVIGSPKIKAVLVKIAADEERHCQWVGELLDKFGIEKPIPSYSEDRYWKEIKVAGLDDIMAAGHHAEAMRLVRIKALAADAEIDEDVRKVFQRILPDEEMHAKAFAAVTTPEAIARMEPFHQAGLKALGLEL